MRVIPQVCVGYNLRCVGDITWMKVITQVYEGYDVDGSYNLSAWGI